MTKEPQKLQNNPSEDDPKIEAIFGDSDHQGEGGGAGEASIDKWN
jgi:hypothetical protein